MSQRRWEVDAARGVAVLLMVGYHFFFDLHFLGVAEFALYDGGFLLWQRTVAALFLGLVGVSLVLTHETRAEFGAFVKRGAALGGVALGITAVTLVVPGEGAIVWGVIHFIAASVVLGFFFLRFYWLNLALGVGLLFASLFVSLPALDTPALLWLGFPPVGFYTFDYYPLFPWFGLVLLGIFVGKTLYGREARSARAREGGAVAGKNGGRNAGAWRLERPFDTRGLEWVGRHALAVYVAHQPVLVGAILAAKALA